MTIIHTNTVVPRRTLNYTNNQNLALCLCLGIYALHLEMHPIINFCPHIPFPFQITNNETCEESCRRYLQKQLYFYRGK